MSKLVVRIGLCSQCNKDKNKFIGKICHDCYNEKRRLRYKKMYKENKEFFLKRNKKFRDENKEKTLNQNRNYYKNNKEKVCLGQKNYYQNNKDKKRISGHNYYIEHKEHLHKRQKVRLKERMEEDFEFKINYKIRNFVSHFIHITLNKQGSSKNEESCLKYLGYSIDLLKEYLEKQFEPWMNWTNYGNYKLKTWNDNDSSTWNWNIDHIIPQSKLPYTSMEDDNFKKCWALENLRPLSAKENNIKGNR
jgi:hypothetical protein